MYIVWTECLKLGHTTQIMQFSIFVCRTLSKLQKELYNVSPCIFFTVTTKWPCVSGTLYKVICPVYATVHQCTLAPLFTGYQQNKVVCISVLGYEIGCCTGKKILCIQTCLHKKLILLNNDWGFLKEKKMWFEIFQ